MTNYTNTSMIQAELRTTTPFSTSSIPTLLQVSTWISEESSIIDYTARKKFGSNTYSDIIDYDGEDRITLKHTPVLSVQRVLYTTNSLGTTGYGLTNTAVPDIQYTVYKETGEIAPIFKNWSGIKSGMKTIQVDYTAGQSEVPKYIQSLATKMVALRVLDTLIHQNVNETNDGGSISVGSIQIVEPASYGVNSYKSLRDDVDSLKNELIKNVFGVYRY